MQSLVIIRWYLEPLTMSTVSYQITLPYESVDDALFPNIMSRVNASHRENLAENICFQIGAGLNRLMRIDSERF